jgi:hypothetical protein
MAAPLSLLLCCMACHCPDDGLALVLHGCYDR